MRKTQLTLNRMRKYQMLVNEEQEQQEEGQSLHHKLEGKVALAYLKEIDIELDEMRKLNNDRSQRWRNWVENSWGRKHKEFTNGSEERPEADHSSSAIGAMLK
eukprot:11294737-Heterocapsa_arctica.AAC.1